MRARRLIPLVLTCATVLLAAASAQAAAPTIAKVVSVMRGEPLAIYVDPALKLSAAEAAALQAASTADTRVAMVSDVPSPAKARREAAALVRKQLALKGTLVLGFPDGVAVDSTTKTKAQIDAARTGIKGLKGAAAATAMAVALGGGTPSPEGTNTTTTPTTPVASGKNGSGGGISLIVILLAAGALAAVALLLFITLGSRQRRRGGLLDEARSQVSRRTQALGSALAASAIAVADRGDESVEEHHRTASQLVSEVRTRLEKLDGPPVYRRANEALDRAEWHMRMAGAHLEGTAEPSDLVPGRPARCFFDAEHGLGTVEIDLEIGGVRSVTVGVCAEDAVHLSRAEEPAVGHVRVGRRTVPWAAAPTWFGGWGWDPDDVANATYHGRPVFAGGKAAPASTPPVEFIEDAPGEVVDGDVPSAPPVANADAAPDPDAPKLDWSDEVGDEA